MGGFYTVRGFKTQSLSGDSGAFTRNELIYTMPYWLPDEFKSAFAQVDLFAGLDAGGFLPSKYDPTQSGMMSGFAAGMRLSKGPLFGEVSYEHPLSAPRVHSNAGPTRCAGRAALQMVTRGASAIATGAPSEAGAAEKVQKGLVSTMSKIESFSKAFASGLPAVAAVAFAGLLLAPGAARANPQSVGS